MGHIKLGHRWSDLNNTSFSHIFSSFYDSQIEMLYILIAITPLIDQIVQEKKGFILCVYIFIICFTTAEQFAGKNIAVKL